MNGTYSTSVQLRRRRPNPYSKSLATLATYDTSVTSLCSRLTTVTVTVTVATVRVLTDSSDSQTTKMKLTEGYLELPALRSRIVCRGKVPCADTALLIKVTLRGGNLDDTVL